MAATYDPDLPPAFPLPNSAQRSMATKQPQQQQHQQRQSASGNQHQEDQGSKNRLQPNNGSSTKTAAPSPSFTVSGPSKASSSSANSGSSSSKLQALRSVLDDSPQRPSPSSTTENRPTATRMGPPPSSSSAPTSSSASLMPPPSTSRLTAPPGVGGASGTSLGVPGSSSTSTSASTGSSSNSSSGGGGGRKKVVLTAGHSPLDWARLKSQLAAQQRPFAKIPLSEVKKHKSKDDAWSIFNGKVYNITPYLEFHPGGVDELMRVAGRDGTRLFMLTHSWVNIDAMIDACCIGMLVKDE